MKRNSTAVWHGTGKDGTGKIASQSKALDHVSYSWKTRFTEEKGTNPEELIAAAHASCYTMKLSFLLGDAGHSPEVIRTACTVTLDEGNITGAHLDVRARVPGLSNLKFAEYAEKARLECPIGKAFQPPVSLTAMIIDELIQESFQV